MKDVVLRKPSKKLRISVPYLRITDQFIVTLSQIQPTLVVITYFTMNVLLPAIWLIIKRSSTSE